jgi:hypothetical protein
MTSNGPTAEQLHTSGRDTPGKPASHIVAGNQRVYLRGRR